MAKNSLRPVATTVFALGSLLAPAAAQSPAQPKAPAEPTPAAEPQAPTGPDPRLVGLPTFLLPVPAGTVAMGIDTDELIAAACQTINPARPELALRAPDKLTTAMKRSASLLGKRKVQVDEFLLGKWPVKNGEYEVFVTALRARGEKIRPPFHWWREGCEADYNEKLADINRLFPKDKEGPLLYWEREGDQLPFKVQDKKGNSIADLPVTYVSYRDAMRFCGWLGMRLPLEVEWTRAARGDGSNVWPTAVGPSFTEQALKALRMDASKDKALKPVGSVAAAAGPFGHVDMFGQVWQFVAELGYRPLNGSDAFQDEWKRFQKDKSGALVQNQPLWKDEVALAKGGSYLSYQEPIQLLLDQRAPLQTIDVMESLGFRLAKSLKPGYDMLYSLLRSGFSRARFVSDQDIDLGGQIGAERYDLGPNGFPTAYHAVTFAPVNWLSKDKTMDLPKLLDKSQQEPLLVGTFAATDKLLEPALPAGHYSVLFRKEGMPKELVDAIKVGHKEVLAALKNKKKGEEEAKEEDKKDDKKVGWREICARYGITEKDLESKEAGNGLKFVRIDGLEVSTERDVFLLQNNEGKLVAALPATNKKPAAGNPFAPAIEFHGQKDKLQVRFKVGGPVTLQNPKKVAEFHFHVVLDRAVPGADQPWRLPVAPQ